MNNECEKLEEQLTPWLLGDLPEAAAAPLQAHLATCAVCRALADDLRATLALYESAFSEDAAPRHLSRDRREQVNPAPAPVVGEARPKGVLLQWFTAEHVWLKRAAIAMIFAIGVVVIVYPMFSASLLDAPRALVENAARSDQEAGLYDDYDQMDLLAVAADPAEVEELGLSGDASGGVSQNPGRPSLDPQKLEMKVKQEELLTKLQAMKEGSEPGDATVDSSRMDTLRKALKGGQESEPGRPGESAFDQKKRKDTRRTFSQSNGLGDAQQPGQAGQQQKDVDWDRPPAAQEQGAGRRVGGGAGGTSKFEDAESSSERDAGRDAEGMRRSLERLQGSLGSRQDAWDGKENRPYESFAEGRTESPKPTNKRSNFDVPAAEGPALNATIIKQPSVPKAPPGSKPDLVGSPKPEPEPAPEPTPEPEPTPAPIVASGVAPAPNLRPAPVQDGRDLTGRNESLASGSKTRNFRPARPVPPPAKTEALPQAAGPQDETRSFGGKLKVDGLSSELGQLREMPREVSPAPASPAPGGLQEPHSSESVLREDMNWKAEALGKKSADTQNPGKPGKSMDGRGAKEEKARKYDERSRLSKLPLLGRLFKEKESNKAASVAAETADRESALEERNSLDGAVPDNAPTSTYRLLDEAKGPTQHFGNEESEKNRSRGYFGEAQLSLDYVRRETSTPGWGAGLQAEEAGKPMDALKGIKDQPESASQEADRAVTRLEGLLSAQRLGEVGRDEDGDRDKKALLGNGDDVLDRRRNGRDAKPNPVAKVSEEASLEGETSTVHGVHIAGFAKQRSFALDLGAAEVDYELEGKQLRMRGKDGQSGDKDGDLRLQYYYVQPADWEQTREKLAQDGYSATGGAASEKAPAQLLYADLSDFSDQIDDFGIDATWFDANKNAAVDGGVVIVPGAEVQLSAELAKVAQKVEPEFTAKPEEESEPVFRASHFNPYVHAAENRFSTFGIDVDSAAYTLARRYILNNTLPPPEAVRTEEMVNFFNYQYPSPKGATFAIHTEAAPSPFGPGHLLKIGVKGKVIGRDQQRAARLTFCIDASGSMDKPDRMGLIRKSLKLLVQELGEHDQVAIVYYGSKAHLLLEHTSDKQQIAGAIDSIQTGGSTHLEDGLVLAYETASKAFDSRGVNRVLLLSDGAANLGSGSAEAILAKVENYTQQGIFSSVFGFGIGTYNDVMLETLANKGDGSYQFVDSEDEARRIFVQDLSATLNTIASDVKIQVEFNPERVKQYRQFGYENRQLTKEQFRDDSVDAGEIGSGQAVTALYEMELTGEDEEQVAVVRVRYRDLETGEVEEIEQAVTAAMIRSNFDQVGPRFKLAAGVAEFAELLRGSPYADDGDYREVGKLLRPVALELHLDQHVQELIRLVQAAPGLPRAPE